MGKRYVQHSDMCGCERCAREWDHENPHPVFDVVDDPDILDCGCEPGYCRCWDDDGRYDEPDPDEISDRLATGEPKP